MNLADDHLFHPRYCNTPLGVRRLVLSSTILDPSLADADPAQLGRRLAARYLDHPLTCDFAEDLANFEMILRARRMADGRDPAAMLRMTFVDSGVPSYGLILVEVKDKPIYSRQRGRA